MAQYRVLDADGHGITLVDTVGRRHVARALHDALPVGAELHGPHPLPGFAILADASTRRLCRVIFEQIDCGDARAMGEARVQ
jgi:hypothetical protein